MNPPRRASINDAHLTLDPRELERLTIRIDRSTIYGNPFRVGMVFEARRSFYRTKAQSLELYEQLWRDRLRGQPGPNISRYNADGKRISSLVAGGAQTTEERDREIQIWLDRLANLEDKVLLCWCRPNEPCHADVLIRLHGELPKHKAWFRARQLDRTHQRNHRERSS